MDGVGTKRKDCSNYADLMLTSRGTATEVAAAFLMHGQLLCSFVPMINLFDAQAVTTS